MALEFLAGVGTEKLVLLIIVFFVFVILVRKVVGTLKNMLWIAVAAVLFPLVANRFLGLAVPVDVDSIIFFIVVGEAAYLIYVAAKFFRFFSRLGGRKPARKPVKEHQKKADKNNKLIYEGEPRKKEFYKDYVVLEDDNKEKTGKRKEKPAVVEELPEIKHRKKHKK